MTNCSYNNNVMTIATHNIPPHPSKIHVHSRLHDNDIDKLANLMATNPRHVNPSSPNTYNIHKPLLALQILTSGRSPCKKTEPHELN